MNDTILAKYDCLSQVISFSTCFALTVIHGSKTYMSMQTEELRDIHSTLVYSCKTMSSEKLVCDRLTVVGEQLLLYRHLLHVYHIFYSS